MVAAPGERGSARAPPPVIRGYLAVTGIMPGDFAAVASPGGRGSARAPLGCRPGDRGSCSSAARVGRESSVERLDNRKSVLMERAAGALAITTRLLTLGQRR